MTENKFKTQNVQKTDTVAKDEKQDKKPSMKQIRNRFFATMLGFAGFFAVMCAVGTEDDRMEMDPERAKTELASEKTTLLMGAAGLTAMFGALALSKRNDGR